MLIRAKKRFINGVHGETKKPADPPFEVADERGKELVRLGVAVEVDPEPPRRRNAREDNYVDE